MAATLLDLSGLLKGIPSGAWVAISEDQNRVMAYGADAQSVANKAKEAGEGRPLMVRVPEQSALMFF